MPDSARDGPHAISAALDHLIKSVHGERVRLQDLIDELGGRAFALLTLLLSLPNAVGLGAIPGLSTVFGLPQLFIALQRALGYRRPWLPKWLLEKSIARADLDRAIERARPYLRKLERVMRPRWEAVVSPLAEQLLAGVIATLAVLISLPLPLANQPAAVAIAIITLGLIARDGLVVAVGLCAAALATALAAGMVVGGTEAILALTRRLFGG